MKKIISQGVMRFYVLFTILLIYTRLSYGEISSPEECARDCRDNEEPKNCYYRFHIEFYTTIGPACNYTFLDQCIIGDGFEKTLIPINRQLPGPLIKVCVNDRIIVDVENAASGNEVTLHWHGIFQNGYQYYDGVPYVTQCPIPSSTTFRYDFVVKNSGTHFYHSHISTHMLDGQYGGLIVRDPPSKDPHYQLFDKDEIIIFLSDWMHELSAERFPGWYWHDLGQTAKNILINGLGQATDPIDITKAQITNGSLTEYTVKKGERHRIRLINSFTTVCLAELRIEQHELVVIAQDGANVKPKPVDKIVTSTGERVDFILTANQDVDSYWIQVLGLGECNGTRRVQQFAILQYEGGPTWPTRPQPSYADGESATGVTYNPLESTCDENNTDVCVNQLEGIDVDPDLLNVEPDERHILPFWFFNYTRYDDKILFGSDTYRTFIDVNDFSQIISTFNEIAYESPASPLLTEPRSYRTVCKKNVQNSCTEPCTCAQVINTKLNNIVELIIYDAVRVEDLHHPFHLHGYEFKVFTIGQFLSSKNISRANIDEVIKQHTERLEKGEYKNPPGKDTVKIPMGGYVIIRFKANNPGWWLLHCHFTWHHITGMELVIHVGDRNDLPPVPYGFPECSNWTPALHTLNNFYGIRYP
ncbi:oxidoreductase ptaE-like isoform X2 [Frieseomelitta varia]|uniref:oxidoreductase ptaE-like isoform X2 n=1 Tax=Frieseomelitta varia TaxID=561572 RepID=UPI001CB6800F|nr:oxidoreductase ptaE-like isoform X2 [Frieseomelitta varia]